MAAAEAKAAATGGAREVRAAMAEAKEAAAAMPRHRSLKEAGAAVGRAVGRAMAEAVMAAVVMAEAVVRERAEAVRAEAVRARAVRAMAAGVRAAAEIRSLQTAAWPSGNQTDHQRRGWLALRGRSCRDPW
jgi:hypothetical protein